MPAQFFIPDTAPIYAYSPSSSSSSLSSSLSGSSNSSASWVAAYSPRGDGYDQTFHLAAGDASVGINITASALSFSLSSSNKSSTACPAEYRINASSWSSACPSLNQDFVVEDLPAGLHQVELRAVEGEGQLEFMGLGGELDLADGDSLGNLTIDDTSPSFVYSPSSSWTFSSSSSSSSSTTTSTSNATLSADDLHNSFNSSAHSTLSTGAKVELTFQGEALYVYGMGLEDGGRGEVRVDGVLQAVIDTSGAWTTYSSLLYMGSGFSAGAHTLSITSTSSNALIIDYALLTTRSSSSSSSTNLGLIVGVTIGVSAFLIILGASAYVWLVQRQSTKKGGARYPFAGYGKNAAATYSNFGSLASKDSGWDHPDKHYLQRSQSTLALGTSGMRLGTTTVYSDYLPYRGPIEPPPSHLPEGQGHHIVQTGSREEVLAYGGMKSSHGSASSSGMSTPPLISGANPSATGWLRGAREWVDSPTSSTSFGSASFSAGTGYTGSRSGSQRSAGSGVGGRRSPLDRATPGAREQIPLDLYQPALSPPPFSSIPSSRSSPPRTASTPLSPSSSLSTPSTLGLGMGEQVQQAVRMPAPARSVARLWPTRDAEPSSYRTESVMQGAGVGIDDRRAGYSSSSLALNASTSVDALSSQGPAPTTPTANSAMSLRRGVSIKSVKSIKTMRSFFSGMIFVPPTAASLPHLTRSGGEGEGEPQTPAVPWTAARPDSGIFPGLERGLSQRFGSRRRREREKEKEKVVASVPAKSPMTGMVTRSPLSLARALPSHSRNPSADQMGDVEEGILVPNRSAGHVARDARGREEEKEEEEEGASPKLFIELDPSSPVESSRPASQWTRYTRGSEGMHGRWEV
ncbi:hypothetical protein L202_02501 [Cryptococcus amylolentus CBS 6039]|uniref:Uncharacterized protein n=2 Tax=Cryptococcus amylolentus TaxID=104669 RepID=A0A1E3I0T6_9TREE|nr:hypothetical protein L202_02501 [Cryptococcus amylolentus CBS 6039]ODN82212.1 hypothetical protein L202_02501 [Cryptococcus amylolentus CBS 6039]ODO09704.1 hypothetical protein I350_01918 [Cryptococcus amylolentus CBS 6273]